MMHRIGQKTTLQERVTIGKLAAAGRTDMQIASRLDCSVWTVRKWRRIFAHQGRAGFTSQIGRPATGALSTIPRELQTTIRHLRETHPGWGSDTLLIALRADAVGEKQHLPRTPVKKCCARKTSERQALDSAFIGGVEAGIRRR